MTKRKPNEVIELRISLQDKLNSQADIFVAAESAKSWASALNQVASFENLYVIVTALEIITGEEILPGTPNDAPEILDALRTWWTTGTGEGSPIGEIRGFFSSIFGGTP